MKRSSKTSEHSDVPAQRDLMHGLMLSVVEFMARAGMADAAIHHVFQQCVSQPASQRNNRMPSRKPVISYGCDTIAGAVLRAWHKFPMYLDSAARPVRLRMDGREPNLTSLVLSQDKRADARTVIRSMLNAGLLRKHGPRFYSPEKDAATIDSLHPLSVDHIAKTIMRLVETATRNIEKSRSKLQLIERYAHVPDLTRSEAKSFAAFSRQQGQACLDAIEDWLEARQANHVYGSKKVKKGVNAGVHIFAYLGQPAPKKKRVLSKVLSKRPTRTPEARA